MAISTPTISTRFPHVVRSQSDAPYRKALVLRLIDSGIIMVLSCFLVYFLVFAFQASGMVYDNLWTGQESVKPIEEAKYEAPETPDKRTLPRGGHVFYE